MSLIRLLFRRHPYHSIAVLLTATLALGFAIRLTYNLIYWEVHANEPIRPWMTVGYIGRSYDLSPKRIDEIAGLPMPDPHPYTIRRIARERDVSEAEIIALIEAAITELQSEKRKGGHNTTTPDQNRTPKP